MVKRTIYVSAEERRAMVFTALDRQATITIPDLAQQWGVTLEVPRRVVLGLLDEGELKVVGRRPAVGNGSAGKPRVVYGRAA